MQVPITGSHVLIEGQYYRVSEKIDVIQADGLEGSILLTKIDGIWYPLEATWQIEKVIGKQITPTPSQNIGQIFLISEHEYQSSAVFVGFIILNPTEPKQVVGLDNLVYAPITGWDIKIKNIASPLQIPVDILLDKMDVKDAINYCHTYPSDECRESLVKKMYGNHVIRRKPDQMLVSDWVNLLIDWYKEDGVTIDTLQKIKRMIKDPVIKAHLFMALADAYLVKFKLTRPYEPVQRYKAIFSTMIDDIINHWDSDFIDWLIETELVPNKLWVQPIIEAYQIGSPADKAKILSQFRELGKLGIQVDQFSFFTGVTINLEEFDIELLEELKTMGLLKNIFRDEISELKEKDRQAEINWLRLNHVPV